MKLSVIIPIYNAEKYLENCVKSILKNIDNESEVLLVDDGSTDKSGELADKLAKTDARIKVFHKKNGGVSSARNLGISKAGGEFVAFADADDLVCKNMSQLLKNSKGNDLTCFDYYCYKSNTNETLQTDKLKLQWSWNSPCNKFFKLEFLKKNMVKFDENLKIAEDLKFVFTCLNNTQSIEKLDEAYYVYVQNSSSTMSNISFKKICDTLEVCKWEIGNLKNCCNQKLCKKLISENLLSVLIRINNYETDENNYLLSELKKLKK